MTPQEYAIKLENQILELQRDNRPLAIASASAHAMMSRRIFVDGEDKNNSGIGSYSSKGMYRNPNNPGNRNKKGFTPLTGKGGYEGFKTSDKKRKTKYFEGWKGFREAQGLGVGVVNLNYTGELASDFSRPVQVVNVNEYVSSFSRDLSVEKAEGNEDHFGKVIFKLSDKEKREFFSVANKELKLLLER